MVSSDFLIAIMGLVPCFAILLYTIYWALDIRRVFAVDLYRSQALGMGLASLAVAITQSGVTVFSYLGGALSSVLQIAFPYFAVMAVFYWTDASMRTGRRTDPLLRDTLHWRKLRLILIPVLVILFALGFVFSSNPTFSYLFPVPVIVSLLTSAIVLPVMGSRSRYEPFRKQLRWFGFFALSIVVVTVGIGGILIGSPLLLSLLVEDLGVVIGGYCLFRSARSLAPLNRLTGD